MAVITISRQFGAGGKTLGTMIAKKMDYVFLDDLVIKEIAKSARVSRDTVISIERTAGGSLSRFISSFISSSYIDRLTGEKHGYIDENVYVDVLYEVIRKLAARDNVVLMGRGGQYILQEVPDVYHILLIASDEDRVKFMQRYYKLSDKNAKAAVLKGDRRRANLYQKLGKQNYDDPRLYHLVLNMHLIPLETARDLVCDLVTSSATMPE
ncbi:MAG: cytidylate kinase-like family protein [Desulfosudaceae bacterium]